MQSTRLRHRLAALCCAVPLASAAALAWVADDAFISLRVVENATAGLGLRWNVDERVQVFSHPLYLLLLVPLRLLSGSGPLAALALALGAAAASGMLLWRSWGRAAALPALLLGLCKATADHASNGLENGLLHVMLVGFALELTSRRRPAALGAWAGAALLTRPDQLGLVLPGLILAAFRPGRVRLLVAAAGPLVLWMIGSTVYFGSPLPNPALAKLGAGLAPEAMTAQGWSYVNSLLQGDPAAFGLLCAAVAFGLTAATRQGAAATTALAIGMLLQAAILVREGGDFMAGRMWTGAIVVGLCILGGPGPRPRARQAVVTLLVVAAALHPRGPVRGGPQLDHRVLDPAGVADERGFWASTNGWWARIEADRPWPTPAPWGPRQVKVMHNVGLDAYLAGPSVHVIDRFGLTEPLLARLPCGCGPTFRPGHLERPLPDHWEAQRAGVPTGPLDPAVQQVVDDLALLHAAPLTAPGRFDAIRRVLVRDLQALRGAATETPLSPAP